MRTINLALGVHNHQPAGNFDHVLSAACEESYFPFFQVLERHPSIKFSVHFSGFLLSWIAENYPELLTNIRKLVKREQVELVTGGFYEPIIPIIPDSDKLGQIRKLTDYLKSLFAIDGKPPQIQGMWLAERVWEPHLPKALNCAGVKYVCVDDSHFKGVGVSESDLFHSYITEEQGHKLEIFPINQKLRYLIPFETPSKILEYLRSISTTDGSAGAFYFDDGEKFGVWPGTHQSVYTEGWLEAFFTALEQNAEWIKLSTFAEYSQKIGPKGRIYLATASYSEMMEWALPPGRAEILEEALHKVDPEYRSFLKGGFWRYFLIKYPEANHLHKKMLHLSNRIIEATHMESMSVDALDAARDKVWMGQSNDPYWHGVFGGLYLTNLRTANYQALVEAEAILDRELHKEPLWIDCQCLDLDCDGNEEVLISSDVANYSLSPSHGGALVEFSYKPRPFNLTDTLARRPEAYHAKLRQAKTEVHDEHAKTIHGQVKAKEANLEKYLVYDWFRRLSFLDRFLDANTTLEQLSQSQYAEQGDFVVEPYRLVDIVSTKEQVTVEMERHGQIRAGHHIQALQVNKTYTFMAGKPGMNVTYKLTNNDPNPMYLWFAPELNVNFLAPDADDRYFFSLDNGKPLAEPKLASSGVLEGQTGIGIADEWLGIKFSVRSSFAGNAWRYPVFTVSNSESGFERIYQGSAIVPNWHVLLPPGQSWSVDLALSIDKISP